MLARLLVDARPSFLDEQDDIDYPYHIYQERFEGLRILCTANLHAPTDIPAVLDSTKSKLGLSDINWQIIKMGLMCPSPFDWTNGTPLPEGTDQIKNQALMFLDIWSNVENHLNRFPELKKDFDQKGLFRAIGISVNLLGLATSESPRKAINKVVKSFSQTPSAKGADLKNLKTLLLRESKSLYE